jgi:hypothetical protein
VLSSFCTQPESIFYVFKITSLFFYVLGAVLRVPKLREFVLAHQERSRLGSDCIREEHKLHPKTPTLDEKIIYKFLLDIAMG